MSGSRPQPPKPLGSGGSGGGSDDGAGGDDGGGVAGGRGEAGVAALLSLQAKLGEAKARADFEECIRLRDAIEEGIAALEAEMHVASAAGRFEKCIALRNQLDVLKAPSRA